MEEFINGAQAKTEYLLVDIGSNDSNWIQRFRVDVDVILRFGQFIEHWEE